MAEEHRKNKDDRHARGGFFVRFDADTDALLRAEAEAREVSVAWLVRRFVNKGLADLIPIEEFLGLTPRRESWNESSHFGSNEEN